MPWASKRDGSLTELSTDQLGTLITLLIAKRKIRMVEKIKKRRRKKSERRQPQKTVLYSKCVHCPVTLSAYS